MTGIVSQNVGRASGLVKAVSAGGTWTLIKTLTASGDSDLSFVDGTSDVVLDSTYPIYVFKIINLHPSGNDMKVGFQDIIDDLGNDNDQSASGELWLFGPSNTTFVTHWMSTIQIYNSSDYSVNFRTAGYFNTTAAIDEIQFKPESGTLDAGKIKLYGLSDS